IPEALLRAWRLARTEPQGPVYLCLDADLQEQVLERPVAVPDVTRFQPATPPHADPRAIDEAARRLVEARFPLIVVESLGRRPEATGALGRLAERLAAPLVDLAGESEGRPSVPSRHPLDMSGAHAEVVADADVVLALDVTNFLGALGQTDRATRAVRLHNETARVIAISLDDYAIRSWAHTFQSLVPVDLPIAADAALALPALLAAVEDRLERDPRAVERRQRAERIAARRRARLRAAGRARRDAGPPWLRQALRQSTIRRRPALRRERALHRGPSRPAAADGDVQQPHVRQRRGAPGGRGQDARAAGREQGRRHPYRRPRAGLRAARPGLRRARRGPHRDGGGRRAGAASRAARGEGRAPGPGRRDR